MKVKDLVNILLQYNQDVDIVGIYNKKSVDFLVGASPYDENAWYDDCEMPHLASYVELLVIDRDE